MKHLVPLAAAIALSLWCGTAPAQQAYTSKVVNMRAGPARDYPIVAVLPAGLLVDVQGCLSDYRWCDVIAGVNRGWVYAGNISYAYQNRYEPLLSWGPVLGLAILGFTFDDYWQQHYWNRPWYRDRFRWQHVPPPPPQRHWQPPARVPPPSGWAPPHRQPPPAGWAPPHQQPPPSGWAPPSSRPTDPPARPPGRHEVPPGRAQPGPPQDAPPRAAPPPSPPPPQPGAAPRPQPRPGVVPQPQPQGRPAPGRRPPDNSGWGQPQNP